MVVATAAPATAQPALTIEPLTWHVIGLDSNNPLFEGPDEFLSGIRVCNGGADPANNVAATYVFDSANPYIDLSPNSASTLTEPVLEAGECTDFYFLLKLVRSPLAYDTTREFHIEVAADNHALISTPQPRELYVEHLISQNRNDAVSIDGPSSVYVGQVASYTVTSFTATNGYEQLSSFLNFTNLDFQVLSVDATYSAPSGGTNDHVYADACGWDDTPGLTPPAGTYRSCVGPENFVGGKAGGDLVTVYTFKFLSAGSSAVTELIYDFSGSSYHYNADLGLEVLTIDVAEPSSNVLLEKRCSPEPVEPGGTLTCTIDYANNSPVQVLTGVEINEIYDPRTTYVGAVPAPDNAPDNDHWSIGTLNPGDSGSITLTLQVAGGLTDGEVLLNTVSINDDVNAANDAPGDPAGVFRSTEELTAVAVDAPGSALLQITKTGVPDPDVGAGSPISYTISYENVGQATSYATVLTDTIGDGLIFDSSTPAPDVSADPVYQWNLGDLVPGASGSITVDVDTSASLSSGTFVLNEVTVVGNPGAGTNDTAGLSASDSSLHIVRGGSQTQADLSITKVDKAGFDPVWQGGVLTYEFTVSNAGPDVATSVIVTDLLDANSSYLSSDASCVDVAGTVTCSLGDLAVGASVSFNLLALADNAAPFGAAGVGPLSSPCTASADLCNNASVSSSATDPVPGNNVVDEPTDVLEVTNISDLSIAKTDVTDPVVAGGTIVYTLEVTNGGPDQARAVMVVDLLDSNTTYVSDTFPSSCVDDPPGTVTCDYTIINSGHVKSYTITVQVDADAPYTGTLETGPCDGSEDVCNRVASLTSESVDPDLSNNTVSEPTNILPPDSDLSITKSDAGSDPIDQGAFVTYTLSVTNAGPDAANNVTVTDTLDANTTYVSDTSPNGCVEAPVGTLTCNVGTLAIAESVNFDVTVLVDEAAPAAGSTQIAPCDGSTDICNTAVVTSDSTDPDPSDDTAEEPTNVIAVSADLSIDKTDGGDDPLQEGGVMTYTVTFTNSGPNTARNVEVVDTLDANAFYLSDTAPGGCVQAPLGTLTCDVGDIGNGVAVPFDIVVFVPVGAPTGSILQVDPCDGSEDICNTATVSTTTADTDPTNDSDDEPTNVQAAQADVQITKSDAGSDPTVRSGTVVYTLTVTNPGPNDAQDVVVTDVLDADTTYVSDDFGCVEGPVDTLTCDVSVLLAGQSQEINISVTVDAGAPIAGTKQAAPCDGSEDLCNTATVATSTDDPDATNNSVNEPTDVTTPTADLSVSKDDGQATYSPGESLTYTIVVANAGPSDVTGATVTDTFPADLNNVTWTCAGTGTATCTAAGVGNISDSVDIPAGESVTYTVDADADLGATADPLVNTATAAVPGGMTDPDAGNDSDSDSDALSPQADLSVNKDDGSATYTPGGSLTYTITVSNAGPANVTGATVTDTFPGELNNVAWTCVGAGSASCTANGTGNISDAAVNIPVGDSVTYTVNADVDSSATADPLVNTASAAVPAGTTDPVAGNNSDDDSDTLDAQADLAVTKDDGSLTYTPGGTLIYTIIVANNGPSDVTGATVTDTFPAELNNVAWTCVGAGSASCTAAGTGDISDSAVNIPDGDSVTYTVNADVDSSATVDPLVNTASAAVPAGTTDPVAGNNSNSDSDTLDAQADLAVTKDDGSLTYTPGGTLTYTITVANNGPSDVTGATVTDSFPAELQNVTWTCAGAGGASCTAAGTGDISDSAVDIPDGDSVTYTVNADIDSSTTTDPLVNTASAAVPAGVTDPVAGNNSDDDSDTLDLQADLAVTKDDGSLTYTPGGTLTYTITVANNGPSDVTGATVTDTFPAELQNVTWTCAGAGGASCTAAGTGDISDSAVNIPDGDSVTYTVNADVDVSATVDPLVNTASAAVPAGVTDPVAGNDSDDDSDTLDAQADLAVTKDDGSLTYTPGGTLTYTITVANNGPSDVTGATVTDTFPAELLNVTWTCVGAGGASCTAAGTGDISDSAVNIPDGDSVTYTVNADVDSSATVDPLVNTASAAVPAGVTDPVAGNDSDDDSDTLDAQADLAVTKDDGSLTYTPGGTVTYTITVANNGPSDVTGATVTDTFPAELLNVTWTCAGAGGASCTAAGTGDISDSAVNIPDGDSVTYTVNADVDSSTTTDPLVNTASAAVPAGVTDPVAGNDSDDDSDTLDLQADLAVTKDDGSLTYTPGGTLTYTITVANNGPSNVTGATVTDTFPAELLNVTWTCVGAGGASCTAAGTGDISDSAVNIPDGDSVTYTVNADVDSGASVDPLVNTASAAVPAGVTDPVAGNDSDDDSDTLDAQADLAVTKDDGSLTYTPGGTLTYTITVANNGPSDVTGATVTDTFPAELLNVTWTCAGAGAASCTAAGTGDISDSAVNIPDGDSVTYTVNADVDPSATVDPLVNTASAAVPAGVTDPVAGNDSDDDSDTLDAQADLAVTKDDGSLTYTPGGTLTYTITVANNGPSDVTGATVTDTFPAELLNVTWTCAGAGGASCTAAGTGDISDSAVDIPDGDSVTYTVNADVDSSASVDPLVNTASAAVPVGVTDPVAGNDSDDDSDTLDAQADLAVTKDDGSLTYTPGGTLTYTITVANNGPSDVTGATVTDTFPAELLNVTWICAGAGGASCTAAGTGDISDSAVDIPDGDSVTYTVNADVDASTTTDPLVNTASAAVPAGVTDPVAGNDSDDDSDTLDAQADLAVVKDDGEMFYTPGGTLTYTVTVTNNGPSDVTGATVTDIFPAELLNVTWTCVGAGGASCTAAGTGDISDSAVNIPDGDSVTYTVDADVDPGAVVDPLVNTASAAVPAGVTDPVPGNDSDDDSDGFGGASDLVIVKADIPDSVEPGGTLLYRLVYSNSGAVALTNAVVVETYDPRTTFVSSIPTPNIGDSQWNLGTLDPGESGMIEITMTVDGGLSDGEVLLNSAVISADAIPSSRADEETTVAVPEPTTASLRVTKSVLPSPAPSGGQITYTITVTNDGPAASYSTVVSDSLPTGLTFDSATPVPDVSADPLYEWNVGNLGIGDSEVIQVTATVDSAAPRGYLFDNCATALGQTGPGTTSSSGLQAEGCAVAMASGPIDLDISKTEASDPVPIGGDVTYTIVVTNNGPGDASGVVVTDVLDLDTTYVSDDGGCSGGATGTLTCALGDIDSGDSVSFDVVVTVGAAATTSGIAYASPCDGSEDLCNSVSVTGAQTDTDPGNDSADEPTGALPGADLAITKSEDVDPVLAGGTLIYTLVVTNNGPSDAAGVVVTDVLDADTTYVSDDAGCTGGATGTLTCNVGALLNGASTSINVTVQVDAGAQVSGTLSSGACDGSEDLCNNASVAATTDDPDPSNDSADEPTDVTPQADLAVGKIDLSDPVLVGSSFTYRITVTNNGPDDTTGVVVTDTLDADTSYVSDTGGCTGGATGTLTCNLGSLANGASTNFEVTVAVAGSAATGSTLQTAPCDGSEDLCNVATVSSDGLDSNPVNDSDDEPTDAEPAADVAITKSDGAEPVEAGDVLVYTLSVTNSGPSPADNVIVTDVLDTDTTYLSDSGGCTGGATGTLTCDLGTLVAGATVNFTVTVQTAVGAPTGGALQDDPCDGSEDLCNVASVTTTSTDTDPTNDSDDEPTDLVVAAALTDLAIVKTDIGDPVPIGQNLIYTLMVTNGGPDDATNVVVTDTLDTSTTYVSDTGSCTGGAGGVLTCNLGALAGGASTSFQVTVNVPASAPTGGSLQASPCDGTEDLCNNASVTGDETDPDVTNNDADEPSDATPSTDLAVSKVDSTDPIEVAGLQTYTITVTNNGPSDAPDVQVVDVIDPTTIYISDTGGCVEAPLGTLTCDLGPLVAGASTNFDIVAQIGGGAATAGTLQTGDCDGSEDVCNTVTVTTTGADPVPGNDTDDEPTDVEAAAALADLTIVKTDQYDTLETGAFETYTITVTNLGPDTSENVVVTETLDANASYLTDTAGCVEVQTGTLTCDLGNIGAGSSVVFEVITYIDPAAPTAGVDDGALCPGTEDLCNDVSVIADTPDADLTNNAAAQATNIVAAASIADVAVSKIDIEAEPVEPDTDVTYTITVTNNGVDPADNVVVTEIIDVNTTYVSDTGGCVGAGPWTLQCDLGTIAGGGSVVFNVVVHVDAGAPLTGILQDGDCSGAEDMCNSVFVSTSTPDSDPSNNGDSEPTDASLVATCGNGVVDAGETCDPPSGEVCNNTVDDDGDGDIDCTDSECAVPGYQSCDGNCVLAPWCVRILNDPAMIKVFGSDRKKDMFKLHGRFIPTTPVDPYVDGFVFMFTNEFGVIFRGELLPYDLEPAGGKNWNFKDRKARKVGLVPLRDGIAVVRIRRRNDRDGLAYGFRVKGFGDLSLATVPLMSSHVYIGDDTAFLTAEWRGNPGRWKLFQKDY